jgi:hypothetical protein
MIVINILQEAGFFAEDKDRAAELRKGVIVPALTKGQRITIDFKGVAGATQSFVHALISDPIRKLGAIILDLISFKHCNETVKGIIGIVVEYSQVDVEADLSDSRDAGTEPSAARSKSQD